MEENLGCIKDIMNSPLGIESGSTLEQVLDKLLTLRISRLFIFKNGKAIGIVSEKDILNYLYNEKLQKLTSEVIIDEIMHEVFVNDESTTIPEAAKFMTDNRCSSTGVSSKGELVGIVTKTDLTKFYAENYFGKNQVGNQMSSSYFSTLTSDKIFGVVGKMLGSEFSRMVIVSKEKKPVGIISTGDIFRAVMDIEAAENTEKILNLTHDYENILLRYKEFCSYPAEKVMSRGIINVSEGEDLAKACQIILDKGINALGVQDNAGQINGIIGKREILLTLAKE
jgi:predicted transcriptional regulator